jgi:hypothetical protein
MSENTLKFIPIDEQYVPDKSAQKKAREMLASWLPEDSNVQIKVTEQIEFVDSGTNFESVFCSVCGKEISDTWWQQAMDVAYQSEFTNLSIITPCCQTASSLNRLIYEWPAGFARFILIAHNPQEDIKEDEVRLIADVLGCTLKKIWVRY